MNVVGLATIAVILCGALVSPALLAWGIYCLTRRERRGEGVAVIGSGVFVAAALIVVGFLTAPPDSPGIFRLQALIVIAGAFAIGAVAGKGLHVVASWKRQARRLL